MAHQVEWSSEAVRDVEEIADYIERQSPGNAARVVRAIHAATLALDPFPRAFRIVPERGDPDLHETFVYRWRVMYRVSADRIRIVAVVHGSRLLANLANRSFEEPPQAEYVVS